MEKEKGKEMRKGKKKKEKGNGKKKKGKGKKKYWEVQKDVKLPIWFKVAIPLG